MVTSAYQPFTGHAKTMPGSMLAVAPGMWNISCLRVAAVASLVLAAEATADGLSLTEKPDHTTEATVIVDASPARIYELVTDYARWPQILSDVKSVKVEGGSRRDAKVRFRSAALGHEVAVKFDNVSDRLVRFHSVDAPPGAHASGAYDLEPIDGGTRTRVVATFYLDVGGVAGVFMSNKKLRGMRQAKLRADLGDVAALFAARPQAAAR
jgi:uncharacterized membrane protein